MNYDKKIVLITGARRGIGRAIAEMFSKHGAFVIGTATDQYGVQEIDAYLGKRGKGMQLNVVEQHSIAFVLKEIHERFGDVDILVNNAGIIRDSILLNMTDDEWQSVIDVNLTSVYRMSKLVIKPMIKKTLWKNY